MINDTRNLSVIIPHYNTPDLLQRLIESIPNSRDIQIIVVDDNSNIQLAELAALQVRYRERVEFYKNDTGIKGAGTCRNIGLNHAEGRWLLFADADDFFLDGMYEAVSKYFDSAYDEVFFVPTSIYSDTGEAADIHGVYAKRADDYTLAPTQENLLKLKMSWTVPWSKLVRHELVKKHKIWFDEVLVFNDMMFSVKASHYSKNIAISKDVIYCAVKLKGSLTMQVGWKTYEIRLQEYLKVCDFLRKHYTVREMKAMHYTCLGMLYRAVKNKYGIKKYLWIIKVFLEHKLPLWSWGQIGTDSFRQVVQDWRTKRVNSKYMVKGN